MQGVAQKSCALVGGRVEQGMYFYDIRARRLYTVIGNSHWGDPRTQFLRALGDTVAIQAKVWRSGGSAALAVSGMWPWREQPAARAALNAWTPEWTVPLGCSILAALYLLAIGPWRRRLGGTAVHPARVFAFLFALAVAVLSLGGPIHDLAEHYLFSVHMVQHLLLAELFAPLLILGIPSWLWDALLRPRAAGAVWRVAAGVPIGFGFYTVVFMIWHLPPLYNLMMRAHGFHIVMHLMVMVSSVLMWYPVVASATVVRPLEPAAKMLYLFVLGTPMMIVAAIITFANQPLYEWYALAPRLWGLSAVDDQRLGGVIMWVPGAVVFWVLLTVIWFHWSAKETREDREQAAIGTTG